MSNNTRRAYRRLVGVTIAAGLAAAGCGSGDDSSSSPSAKGAGLAPPSAALVSGGKFTVCMDTTFPPMEYFEGGANEPRGFDVTVAKAVSEAWSVKPLLKTVSFDGLLPALQSGRCDVAWSSMYVTPERTEQFPVVPYAVGKSVLLVKDGNPEGISTPDDLAGKTLVAQTGTSLLDTAKKLVSDAKAKGATPPKLQQYPSATDLIQQVVVGRAAAALTINSEAGYRIKSTPGKFAVGYSFDDDQSIGIYFKNPALGAALQKTLVKLDGDGVLERAAAAEGFPADAVKVGPVQGG